VDASLADASFVGCLVESEIYKSFVQSRIGGAAQPNASAPVLGAFEFFLPPRAEQERIASIFTAYDDLIENNRRRMALLEEAARKLYREWFIRLRFPGHKESMKDEGRRMKNGLPEGWERKTLGDLCEAIRDIASPDQVDADTPYIGLEHIPRRSISQTDWGRAEDVTSSKHKFSTGDILFGKIRPYFHKVSLAFVDGVASADAIVIRPNEADLHSLVLMIVSSDAFVTMASQTMREGSKMPRADWKQMQAHEVLRPPLPVLEAFNRQIVPITEQLRNLTFQTRKLRAARDRLLPKLMSGEIEV
jgi:type I restriction enzyme S subunit